MSTLNQKKRILVREEPKKHGTIVRVPLPDACFAYLWKNGADYRLFGFVTDKPIAALSFFAPHDWIATVHWYNLPATCRDVALLPFPDGEPMAASYYKRIDHIHPIFGSAIIIRDGKLQRHRAGTEEEIVGMALDEFYYEFDILPWIEEHRPKMRLVHVADEAVDRQTDLIPVEKREGVRDNREALIEIQVPEALPELFERRDELEEELIGELRVAQCAGEDDPETGHGSMGDFGFDIAVTVETKRFKTAMKIVRKVLKKYKVPDSVWIREFRDDVDEPIEHPLVDPKA